MTPRISIGNRFIGEGLPVYVIAEISANHHQSFDEALLLIRAARDVGADAVKLQTYTPDTITLDSDRSYFRIGKGTIWEGKKLYDLYGEAYTPWDWQPKLKQAAESLGMDLFSTPFDPSAVEFLQQMDVPAFKIASFELVDLPLIRLVGQTGKPAILSTGMATLGEIDEALYAFRDAGGKDVAVLKCTSAYPARPGDMNLRTIPHLSQAFGIPVGLSDHSLGVAVPVAAVCLGACIVEKHLTLDRTIPGPDSSFSLEPAEFKAMVDAVRVAESALGAVRYEPTEEESASRIFRRSLFIVTPMRSGDVFTRSNVRSIRPADGLHPRYLDLVLGRRATSDIEAGTPLHWDLIS